MSQTLVILGGADPDAPLSWAQTDARGELRARGVAEAPGTLPAAPPARTLLVLPGAEARIERLELPARTEAQAQAAAALLFERQLAERQDLHYAVGAPQNASGLRLAAAISKPRLQAWLARCRGLGADPHIVLLDCLAWPVGANEIVIAQDGARSIVAGGVLGGYAIETALAPSLFPRWLSAAHAGDARVTLIGGDAAVWRVSGEARPAVDVLEYLARGAAEASDTAPNLRQGAFAPAEKQVASGRLWRFAALLAAAAFLLQIGSLGVSGWRDQQTASRIMAAAERDFRAARPDVGRIVNLRAQVASQINMIEQSTRHPVLTITEPVRTALQAQPMARVDDVRFEAPGRTVRMKISATTPEALEAVAVALRGQNLSVEARGMAPEAGRFVSELVVEAP